MNVVQVIFRLRPKDLRGGRDCKIFRPLLRIRQGRFVAPGDEKSGFELFAPKRLAQVAFEPRGCFREWLEDAASTAALRLTDVAFKGRIRVAYRLVPVPRGQVSQV